MMLADLLPFLLRSPSLSLCIRSSGMVRVPMHGCFFFLLDGTKGLSSGSSRFRATESRRYSALIFGHRGDQIPGPRLSGGGDGGGGVLPSFHFAWAKRGNRIYNRKGCYKFQFIHTRGIQYRSWRLRYRYCIPVSAHTTDVSPQG